MNIRLTITLFLAIVILVIAQRKDKGPFLWDDDIVQELKAVRQEHKQMMTQIIVNTEKLSTINGIEKISSDFRISERLVILETKITGMQWISGILAAAALSDLVHRIVVKKLGK